MPTQISVWFSTTGIGDPSTNPADWTLDGTDAHWFDNGSEWEEDYNYNAAGTGNFIIGQMVQGGVSSAFSNVSVAL